MAAIERGEVSSVDPRAAREAEMKKEKAMKLGKGAPKKPPP